MILCMMLITSSECGVVLADTKQESEMSLNAANQQNMVVVLKADDIQHAGSYDNDDEGREITNENKDNLENSKKMSAVNNTMETNESNTIHADNFNPSQATTQPESNGVKADVPQVIRQTQVIGTAESPTIDGGLISAPEFIPTSLEAVDAGAIIIMTKLNDTFMNSAAYDLESLIRMAKSESLVRLQKIKTKGAKIWHAWLKSAMAAANVKTKSEANHREIRSHKKVKKKGR
jgi:hypothetical protein